MEPHLRIIGVLVFPLLCIDGFLIDWFSGFVVLRHGFSSSMNGIHLWYYWHTIAIHVLARIK